MISGALERPCGFLARHEQSPTALGISSSRDLYFITMIGWLIRHKEAHSTTTTKKETLIFLFYIFAKLFPYSYIPADLGWLPNSHFDLLK